MPLDLLHQGRRHVNIPCDGSLLQTGRYKWGTDGASSAACFAHAAHSRGIVEGKKISPGGEKTRILTSSPVNPVNHPPALTARNHDRTKPRGSALRTALGMASAPLSPLRLWVMEVDGRSTIPDRPTEVCGHNSGELQEGCLLIGRNDRFGFGIPFFLQSRCLSSQPAQIV